MLHDEDVVLGRDQAFLYVHVFHLLYDVGRVLLAIDDVQLEAAVDLVEGYGRGTGAIGLVDLQQELRGHHTELDAFEVLRLAKRLVGRPVHGTLVKKVQDLQPFAFIDGPQFFVDRLAFAQELGIFVVVHRKQEVKQKNLVLGNDGTALSGGDQAELHRAVQGKLEHLGGGPQSAVREDLQLDVAVRLLLQKAGKLMGIEVHRTIGQLLTGQPPIVPGG